MIRAAVLALGLVAGFCHAPRAAWASGPLRLAGELRVASCARYPCALPAADDARWLSIELAPDGIATSLNQKEGLAWVSMRFALPEGERPGEPTLMITHPADAEEVYLNGKRVGGKGAIRPRYATAVAGPRTLPLPAAALRDGANEIVFFSLLAGRNARFYTAPFLLGERADIEAEAGRVLFPIVATEAAFFSMFIIVLVYYGFLVAKRVFRSDYLFFMAFIALHAGAFFLGSNFGSIRISPPIFGRSNRLHLNKNMGLLSALTAINHRGRRTHEQHEVAGQDIASERVENQWV